MKLELITNTLKTYYIPRIQMHRQAGGLLTYTILVQPLIMM